MGKRLTEKDRRMFGAFMDEHNHCWACGWEPGRVRPISRDNWAAPFRLENHHIIGGSGRKHLRSNLARLCSLCHRLFHGDRIRIQPSVLLPLLHIENVLWLKKARDPNWYRPEELNDLSIGIVPLPEEPDDWFTDGYKERRL